MIKHVTKYVFKDNIKDVKKDELITIRFLKLIIHIIFFFNFVFRNNLDLIHVIDVVLQ